MVTYSALNKLSNLPSTSRDLLNHFYSLIKLRASSSSSSSSSSSGQTRLADGLVGSLSSGELLELFSLVSFMTQPFDERDSSSARVLRLARSYQLSLVLSDDQEEVDLVLQSPVGDDGDGGGGGGGGGGCGVVSAYGDDNQGPSVIASSAVLLALLDPPRLASPSASSASSSSS